jgi:hypothetical protein
MSTLEDDLPDGWEAQQDAEGRVFYIDHNSRRTQWERPEWPSRPPPLAQGGGAGGRVGNTRQFQPQDSYGQQHDYGNNGFQRGRSDSQDSQKYPPESVADDASVYSQQGIASSAVKGTPPMNKYGSQMFIRRPSENSQVSSQGNTPYSAGSGNSAVAPHTPGAVGKQTPPTGQRQMPSRSASFFGSLGRTFVRRPSLAEGENDTENTENFNDDNSQSRPELRSHGSFRSGSSHANSGQPQQPTSTQFFVDNAEIQALCSEIVPTDAIKDTDRLGCFKCHTKFGTMSTKRRCMSCGEIFCGRCAESKMTIGLPGPAYLKPVSVCDYCMSHLR